MLSKAVN